MTALKSTNYTFKNIMLNIKANIRISIIALVLNLLSAPFAIINCLIYFYQENIYAEKLALYEQGLLMESQIGAHPKTPEMYIIIAIICTILFVFTGFIIAFNNFSYLYKKSRVDMVLSLPLTTRQRFFSDYISGVISYIGPFVITSVLSLIISFVGGLIVPLWKTFDVINNITINQALVILIVGGIFIMLMAYTLAILTISCCGSLFEAVAYTLGFNLLIPGTILVVGFLVFGDIYGLQIDMSIIPFISATSPIGGVVKLAFLFEQSIDGTLVSEFISWLIGYIVLTAIFFTGAWFLYKNRKAEDVSKPFVYKLFYYICITVITFCIACPFVADNEFISLGSDGIVALIITSAITYFILDIITNRGFKKIGMTAIRYVVTMASVIVLIVISNVTNGFGVAYSVPNISQVSSVSINYDGVITNYSGSYIVIKNKDSINDIINCHKDILDDYRKSGLDLSENRKNIKIQYNLKSGAKLSRVYNVNPEKFEQIKSIELSDEYIDQLLENLKNSITLGEKYNSSYTIGVRYLNDRRMQIQIDNEQNVDIIVNALKSDLKAMTPERFYNSSSKFLANITIGCLDFYIDENYPNTINALKTLSNNKIDLINQKYEIEDTSRILINQIHKNYNSDFYSVSGNVSTEEIQELIPYLYHKPQIDEAKYTINFGDILFYVDNSINDKVEKLYNRFNTQTFTDEDKVPEYAHGRVFVISKNDENTELWFDCKEDLAQIIKEQKNLGNEYIIKVESTQN